MKELTIGDIIKYQINKKSILPEKLTEGLCTTTSLNRLINGDTRQSFFLVERILQRLGISVNKVTLLHNESDDTLLIMREMICKLLVEKAYTKAEYILSEYEVAADLSSPLHLQYVRETRGVILLEGYGKHEEALELYQKAFKTVLERFEVDKLSDFLLGEEEMILLMLMLREEMKVKNKNISIYARQLLNDNHYPSIFKTLQILEVGHLLYNISLIADIYGYEYELDNDSINILVLKNKKAGNNYLENNKTIEFWEKAQNRSSGKYYGGLINFDLDYQKYAYSPKGTDETKSIKFNKNIMNSVKTLTFVNDGNALVDKNNGLVL